jgi:hypothetical protein
LVYNFTRIDGQWYIYFDVTLGQSLSKQDLELIEGAQKVLNTLSNGEDRLRLHLGLEPFEGAKISELVEHCAAPKGGGIYLYKTLEEHNSCLYWICDLALFVFGDIPERIYIKRLPSKEKNSLKELETNARSLHRNQNPLWMKNAV